MYKHKHTHIHVYVYYIVTEFLDSSGFVCSPVSVTSLEETLS